jgi:glutamate formiminotransferase
MATHLNPDAVIECVPNFSEGMDATKVAAIVSAMKVEGVRLLDWSLDTAHNRSVVTIAGPADAVMESAVRGVGRASQLIDLTKQSGVHPRIGAADVVPFVPVSGVSLAECAMLARQAGLEIWRRFSVPVYFYEAAAARPEGCVSRRTGTLLVGRTWAVRRYTAPPARAQLGHGGF